MAPARGGLLVEFPGNVLQEAADFQMRGADAFAGAAFQAVLCPGAFLGADVIVVVFRVPVVPDPLGVQQGEEVGDGNALGADLGAVAAGGAGDGAQGMENGADLKFVSQMLGYTDITAMQVYADIIDSGMREEYQKAHPRA